MSWLLGVSACLEGSLSLGEGRGLEADQGLVVVVNLPLAVLESVVVAVRPLEVLMLVVAATQATWEVAATR